MRLNKLYLAIAVPFAALLAACQPEPAVTPQISTDQGIYEIGADGGDITIKLLATEDWTAKVEPATSLDNADGISVSPASGSASEQVQTVTVHVAANAEYNRAALVSFIGSRLSGAATINQAGAQGERVLRITCAEFNKKPVDASVYYELCGTVTNITDEYYNDFYINDGTVEGDGVYVYGLYESKGASRINYYLQQMDIREGDILTLRAYRGEYNGTIEAMQAFYVSHEKSKTPSIALGLESYEASAAGETFDLAVSSNAVTWTLSSDVDWITFEPATGNASATVKVTVAPGEGGTGTVTLSANGLDPVTCTVIRADVQVLTVAEFNALPDDLSKNYQVSGIVSGINEGDKYGNFYITDETGTMYTYGFLAEKGGATQQFQAILEATGLKNGDYLTLIGPKTSYKDSPQAKNSWYVSHISSLTVAEFLALEDKAGPYVLKGKITNVVNTSYGNFDLVDETGTIYVYGIYDDYTADKATKQKVYEAKGLKEGDIVTLFGPKSTYNGVPQVNGSTYVLHEEGTEPEPEPTPSDTLVSVAGINAAIAAGEGTSEFVVKLSDAVVTYVNGGNAFIEDATGGIQLYKSGHGLVAGQKINGVVSGSGKMYNGYAEATDWDVTKASVEEGAEIPCTTLTLAELLADYVKYQNMRVKLEGVTVTDGLDCTDASNLDRNGKIAQGEAEIALYAQVKSDLVIATDAKGSLISYPTRYKENLQLGVWESAFFTPSE